MNILFNLQNNQKFYGILIKIEKFYPDDTMPRALS